jgi:hypothetical protein
MTDKSEQRRGRLKDKSEILNDKPYPELSE